VGVEWPHDCALRSDFNGWSPRTRKRVDDHPEATRSLSHSPDSLLAMLVQRPRLSLTWSRGPIAELRHAHDGNNVVHVVDSPVFCTGLEENNERDRAQARC
jgi:hypothetical protein